MAMDLNIKSRFHLFSFFNESTYKPTKFSEAGRHVMEVVHGIPMLFDNVNLGELEIYIGRSFFNHSIPSQGVYQRFRWHLENRGHDYGIVALSCQTDMVPLWERAMIRTIAKLRQNKKLCVSDIVNVGQGGMGNIPSCPESVIYITWTHGKPTKIQHLNVQQITPISKEISADLNHEIPWPQIKGVLSVTTDVEQYLDIAWGHDLDEDPEEDPDLEEYNRDHIDEVGRLTLSAARRNKVESSISDITGLSVNKVKKILETLSGQTHVRNAFLENWPERRYDDSYEDEDEEQNEIEYIGDLSIGYCRGDEGIAENIARMTGLSLRKTKEILNNTHGRRKIKYAFDEWPWPDY
jgi:hypothetical protein